MAQQQTDIHRFFAVRRKRTDNYEGAAKRRKLSDGARQDVVNLVQENEPSKNVISAGPGVKNAVSVPSSPVAPVRNKPAMSPAKALLSKAKNSDVSPQLQKFKTLEFESPSKKPRFV